MTQWPCVLHVRGPSDINVTFYRWPSDLVYYILQRSSDICVCYILQIMQWPTCGLYFTDHLPGGILVLHFTDCPVTYLLWAVFHRLPGDLLVFTDHPVTYLYNTLFYYERRLSSVPLMKRRLVSAIIGQCLSHFVSRPVCVGERRPQAPVREVLVWMDIASLECVFEEIWHTELVSVLSTSPSKLYNSEQTLQLCKSIQRDLITGEVLVLVNLTILNKHCSFAGVYRDVRPHNWCLSEKH